MRVFAFEKLTVWQDARELAVWVYEQTNKFPNHENYGIKNQMKRCAISVSSNIAEGTGRLHKKEKIQFIAIAYSSLIELLNQLIISVDIGYLDSEELEKVRPFILQISYKLTRLQQSIKQSN